MKRPLLLSGAAALALALCLHLFFLSRGFYSVSWDEAGRTLDAYGWATRGVQTGRAWLPFYRICVGLGLKLYPDLVVVPRVITLGFGLGAIAAAAWLAQELFEDRRTTLLTLTLAVFLPERVALTLAPLSDMMFTGAIVAALALFTRWARTGSRAALLWCAAVAAVATTIRFEGWIFAAVLFAAAAMDLRSTARRIDWRTLLAFGAILFSFVAWWTFASTSSLNPIPIVVDDARAHSTWQNMRKNPFTEFVVSNALSLNLVGVAAALYTLRRGPTWARALPAAAFLPLLVASSILVLIHASQTGPSWRMAGVWAVLLLPFTARLLASVRISSRARLAATAVVLAAFVAGILRLERSSSWAFPESDRRAGEYLETWVRAEPDTKILIESSTFAFLNVQVASQRPMAFVRNSAPERDGAPILPTAGPVRETLAARGVDLLVFHSDEYKRLLDGSRDVVRVGQFGAWSVYARR